MRANTLSMAAGTFQARWASLPVFWRAQIAGWTLFAVVDLLNRQLAYGDFAVSLALTLTVTFCLATMSSVMGAVYGSRAVNNRLTQRALVLIASLSLACASVVALILFTLRQTLGWTIPHWGPVEEIVIPLIHYSLALMGWSFCYFWITAAVAEQAQRRHAMRAEADALRAELEELRLQLDPHFLFNALTGVAEEVPEHPAAAVDMLRSLTAYLRLSHHHEINRLRADVQQTPNIGTRKHAADPARPHRRHSSSPLPTQAGITLGKHARRPHPAD